MYCVQTNHLSHRFSRNEPALKEVNLHVPEGGVYGFLGPNGAGKTTTLRLLLGLLRQQEGEILFFGKSFCENRIESLGKVGSLIESPSLYGNLTAKENLLVWQKIYRSPLQRIDEMLSIAGLSGTGKKKTRHFSLGMKQRLGIAIAMLNDPSILILDEPTNGLDPQGMIEVRDLLKSLNQEKKTTIIVSSHILSEIEKIASHIGVIHHGGMLFEGTLSELHERQQSQGSIIIRTNDPQRALQLIGNATLYDEKIKLTARSKEETASINRMLVEQGLDVYEISHHKNDLESIFMNLLNNQ